MAENPQRQSLNRLPGRVLAVLLPLISVCYPLLWYWGRERGLFGWLALAMAAVWMLRAWWAPTGGQRAVAAVVAVFFAAAWLHARARGAKIYAEIVGFGSNGDGSHVTRPEETTMHRCMQLALDDAGIAPQAVGYVNGHGTATEQGDIAETRATERLFGSAMPISSQKSYLGHTLGACGALETWFSIAMMHDNWFAPTLNLNQVDPRCGELDYIVGEGRRIETEYVLNNNFAFGGVNTSLVLKRWD